MFEGATLSSPSSLLPPLEQDLALAMGNGKRQSARLAARQASKQSTQHPGHPRRTPPFPSPTTIYDLPLETIGRIISIACSAAPANWWQRQERNRFLKATSLVCREWTPFAQEALWLDVELRGTQIESFVCAGPGRYPVRKLLVISNSASEHSFEAVLRDVRGVRELELCDCPVSMDWLCGDNLKDLKTLVLNFVTESAIVASHSLPFHLATLMLSFDNTPSSSSLIDALSRQSSITSLVVFTCGFDPAELLTRLAPLAPGLVDLDITFDPNLGAADDFLKHCTRLKRLVTYGTNANVASRVDVPLASWTVDNVLAPNLSRILDVLESESVAVSKLERLLLRPYRSDDVRSNALWSELKKKCQEKKIKLVLQYE